MPSYPPAAQPLKQPTPHSPESSSVLRTALPTSSPTTGSLAFATPWASQMKKILIRAASPPNSWLFPESQSPEPHPPPIPARTRLRLAKSSILAHPAHLRKRPPTVFFMSAAASLRPVWSLSLGSNSLSTPARQNFKVL